ncbi:MAG: Hsp20/alpha crystallin family protein [bacterium]|nr:Hsp20/alpha crystallin family protein [bacterium]
MSNETEKFTEEGQLTVDVYQTATEVIIQSTVAGTASADIDIALAKDMVTIRGARHNGEKISPDAYDHRELYWGPFSRSIILPTEIDVERSKAVIKNGLLTIKLPKLI